MNKKLESLRHTASHVLAQAVKELYPKAKLGIGPAIEDGFYYDFDISPAFTDQDLNKIEKKMKDIIKRNIKLEKITASKAKAKTLLKGQKYKQELLKDLKGSVTFYKQGDFMDLCAGPHALSTGKVKHFKLLKTAGAYWKGESKNKMLSRIYGIAFETEKELKDHLNMLEEAQKRNHIKLGKELDLFSFHEQGPGFPFWHPKGTIVYNSLINFWRESHKKEGYHEIQTPIILNKELWLKSGHWDNYKEEMYFTKVDKKDYAIKPMNCPGGILIYKSKLHSYKEFPLKISELGLVHRHELSGVLNGLFRVRVFTQDDAHVYCTENQLKDELIAIIRLADEIYKTFNLTYEMELSTKPEKAIGSAKMWNAAEKALKGALKNWGTDYKTNKGEGAFYGPKIDFHIKDRLGRRWQCGTIQVDFAMPERFNLTYDGRDGKKHKPIMIHRAILGSIERFIGILTENYAGKFPLWLSPIQVKILTVNDKNKKYANEIKKLLEGNRIRVELDDRVESINKKVRDAVAEKINYIVNIGNKEVRNKKLAVRSRDGKVKFGVSPSTFLKQLKKEIEDKC